MGAVLNDEDYVIVKDCGNSLLFYHSNDDGSPVFTNKIKDAYTFRSYLLACDIKAGVLEDDMFTVKRKDKLESDG